MGGWFLGVMMRASSSRIVENSGRSDNDGFMCVLVVSVCMSDEIVNCPDCGEKVTADAPEFAGDGTMFRTIGCPECGWVAVEEWELAETEPHE